MVQLTIRELTDDVVARLCGRAVRNGNSLEDEIRRILEATVESDPPPGIGTRMHARWVAAGGGELDIPRRTELPRELDLE
jgi:plasmid stability protein